MNTSDESSFQFSICSAAGDRLILLTDAESSVKSAIVGRASLREGLSRKDPFLSRNHARVEIEGVGLNAVVRIVAIHRNPCYVVRKSGENVVKVRRESGWTEGSSAITVTNITKSFRPE